MFIVPVFATKTMRCVKRDAGNNKLSMKKRATAVATRNVVATVKPRVISRKNARGTPFPLLKCLRTSRSTRLQDSAYTMSKFFRRYTTGPLQAPPVLRPRHQYPAWLASVSTVLAVRNDHWVNTLCERWVCPCGEQNLPIFAAKMYPSNQQISVT